MMIRTTAALALTWAALLLPGCGKHDADDKDVPAPKNPGESMTLDTAGSRNLLRCYSSGDSFKLIYLREKIDMKKVYLDLFDGKGLSVSPQTPLGLNPVFVRFQEGGKKTISSWHDFDFQLENGQKVSLKEGQSLLRLDGQGAGVMSLPGFAENLAVTCKEDKLVPGEFINRDIDTLGVSHSAYTLEWKDLQRGLKSDVRDEVLSVTAKEMEPGYQPVDPTKIQVELQEKATGTRGFLDVVLSVDMNKDGLFGAGDSLVLKEFGPADLNAVKLAGKNLLVSLSIVEPYAGNSNRVVFQSGWGWTNRAECSDCRRGWGL